MRHRWSRPNCQRLVAGLLLLTALCVGLWALGARPSQANSPARPEIRALPWSVSPTEETVMTGGYARGYAPLGLDMTHLREGQELMAPSDALPTRWDWRELGVVTHVSNQNPCISCRINCTGSLNDNRIRREIV